MSKLIKPKLRFDAACGPSIKGKNDRIFTSTIRSSLDDFIRFYLMRGSSQNSHMMHTININV